MSQSDLWLLSYAEKRQNKWLLQKQHFCCFPAMSESSKFPKKWFWRRIKIFANYFKGLRVLSIHIRALSIF